MAADLTPFLVRTLEQPFEWGVCDCTLWVADWCVERWGVDPAATFRGRYGSAEEAGVLTAAGLVETIRPFMGFAVETAEPQVGDVGVVEIDGKQTSAIRTEGGWTIKTPAGLGEKALSHLIAWGA